jgi:hypothetical protein
MLLIGNSLQKNWSTAQQAQQAKTRSDIFGEWIFGSHDHGMANVALCGRHTAQHRNGSGRQPR